MERRNSTLSSLSLSLSPFSIVIYINILIDRLASKTNSSKIRIKYSNVGSFARSLIQIDQSSCCSENRSFKIVHPYYYLHYPPFYKYSTHRSFIISRNSSSTSSEPKFIHPWHKSSNRNQICASKRCPRNLNCFSIHICSIYFNKNCSHFRLHLNNRWWYLSLITMRVFILL